MADAKAMAQAQAQGTDEDSEKAPMLPKRGDIRRRIFADIFKSKPTAEADPNHKTDNTEKKARESDQNQKHSKPTPLLPPMKGYVKPGIAMAKAEDTDSDSERAPMLPRRGDIKRRIFVDIFSSKPTPKADPNLKTENSEKKAQGSDKNTQKDTKRTPRRGDVKRGIFTAIFNQMADLFPS